jgi:hypothetical protein
MKQEEIDYIIEAIKRWRNALSHEHYQWYMNSSYTSDFNDDGSTSHYLKRGLRSLYHHILLYLEVKEVPEYLQLFRDSYGNKMSDDKFILKDDILHPEGEPELVLLNEFYRFLSPFKDFDYSANDKEEINHLLEVLKGTRYILQNLKTEITNETSIYKEVKWVLKLFYPEARKAVKADFHSLFKSYEPDVLIPELKTAVEYKLIRTSANIEDYIDQVSVDAINYKGDYRYENFIAVLCIENAGSAPEKNIRKAWSSKNFPTNWDLVIVFL